MRRLLLFLVLVGCGTETKDHCAVKDDCLHDDQCVAGVCQGADHDACGAAHDQCAPEAVCSDAGDALACTCGAGFTGDGRTCTDVDECSTTVCAAHGSCTNQPGSFSCACDDSFTGDGTSYCVPSKFTKLAVAGGFTCALSSDGGIYCWGSNYYGDLGDGTSLSRTRPSQVGTSTDWIDVGARRNVGCGLRADHSLWCWGDGSNGQLGDGQSKTSYVPVKVVNDKATVGWRTFSVGRSNVCAIHTDGSLACWGVDKGVGTNHAVPTAVGTDTDWTQVSAGDSFCGLRDGGHLYCWGRADYGALGLGDVKQQATPVQVGSDTWKSVSVGYYNTCGIRSDGALLCWGNHPFFTDLLQHGTTPTQIGTRTDWESVTVSYVAAYATRAGGKAYAWGTNEYGELAQPFALEVVEPTPLGDPATVWTQVMPGNIHGCGIANEQTYCWGQISDGMLGDGETTVRLSPTRLTDEVWDSVETGLAGIRGIRHDGGLMTSGYYAQAGVGLGNLAPVWSPVRIGTDTWSAVSTSQSLDPAVSCAIHGGTPYCWGDNAQGQLGIGNRNTPVLSPTAVKVLPGSQWKEIAAGPHTCAIDSDGGLFCWGPNHSGELGDGTSGGDGVTAPTTQIVGTWSHVVVGFDTTCAIRADHTLWCWGKARPTDPDAIDASPVQVGTATDWDSIALQRFTTMSICGRKLDHTLWCWGETETATGTQTVATPTQFGTDHWAAIALGSGERCGIKDNGTLWCWNNADILGDGSPLTLDTQGNVISVFAPTQLGTDTDWASVTLGSPTCARKTSGTVWCWGYGAAASPQATATPTPLK